MSFSRVFQAFEGTWGVGSGTVLSLVLGLGFGASVRSGLG